MSDPNRFETGEIPVIDVSAISLNVPEYNVQDRGYQDVGDKLCAALASCGFAYLKNHGIDSQTVKECMTQAKEFFSMPQPIKAKYSRGIHEIQGYSSRGREVLEDESVVEAKESLDVANVGRTGRLPDTEVPDLRPALESLACRSSHLARRLLRCLATDLGTDPEEFLANHSDILTGVNNASAIRLLHYPPLNSVGDNSGKRVTRCGMHTDYGGLTLLFQDASGGLEVQSSSTKNGIGWVRAAPIEGTIVVNIGDLLQFWSGGRYRATPHRVVADNRYGDCNVHSRYSVAVFIHPNHDTKIEPLRGEKTFGLNKSDTALKHIQRRFSETYTTRA